MKRLKDILKEGEEQYDPQAWDNLSRRLDQLMPVKKSNYFSARNFLIAGASALFIGSGVFLFLQENEAKKAVSVPNSENATAPAAKDPVPVPENKEKTSVPGEYTSPEKKLNTEEINPARKTAGEKNDSSDEGYTGPVHHKSEESELPELNEGVQPQVKEFKLPKLMGEYCLDEEIEVYNSNESRFVLTDEAGNVIASMLGGSKTRVRLNKAGTYYFRYPKSDRKEQDFSLQEKAFVVQDVRQPDFTIENEVSYEDGIPFVQLKARDFNAGMNWSSDKGEIPEQSENTKMTVFRKGDYRVTLEGKDENGCMAKKTQVIRIEEEYNLLAPTAFKPSSNDPRNNRFMPYALTQRNTGFELVIIDPESGRTVFKSTSAENAWDGSDGTSEQSGQVDKSYIWKVKMLRPERGEKAEYNGTVLRLMQ